jgi:hypothetical protein
MKYRGIEYSVVQGIGRHVWKWSVSLDTGVSVGGRTATKPEAVAEAERAIDRALAPKKLRPMPPGDHDWQARLWWQNKINDR